MGNEIKYILTDFYNTLLIPKSNISMPIQIKAINKSANSRSSISIWDYFIFNDNLLSFYDRLNINTYILTSGYIAMHPIVKPKWKKVIKGIFISREIGIPKTDVKLYQYVANKLGVFPQSLIFIDDKKINVETANKAGYNVVLYQNNIDTMTKVIKILGNKL